MYMQKFLNKWEEESKRLSTLKEKLKKLNTLKKNSEHTLQ